MKIVFVSNFINHHQYPVASKLYKLTGGEYTFIETMPMPEGYKKGGYPDYSKESFVVKAWASNNEYKKACDLVISADVVLFDGIESLPFEKFRCRNNPQGLSFEVSERWFKRGLLNLLSPRFIKWYINYLLLARKCNVYKLCCGAFVPNDMYILGAFRNKCYKWGYITTVDTEYKLIESKMFRKGDVKIMWCARFLTLKHPELAVEMARKLKQKGYEFVLNIYGDEGNTARGEHVYSARKLQLLIASSGLDSNVFLRGNLPNKEILRAMADHDIFLFTSDRHEGWGAVANESLANGCVLVASDAIGSTPYLIAEGKNGFSFVNKDAESLTEKVKWLLDHPKELREMQLNAYQTMKEEWSPRHAAESLMNLLDNINKGNDVIIEHGPCSMAYPI